MSNRHMIHTPRDLAAGIVRQLQAAGFSAFWVGGCVRDFLLGREPQDYDIATSARPEQVTFANAEADARRRDFTVNGLFYDPVTEKTHDWVNGEADLRAKIIRTIGSPGERFAEDHLRLLRAVRFAAQLGFEIELQTFAAIQRLAPKIELISAERIR